MAELIFFYFFIFMVGLFTSLLINSAFPVTRNEGLIYRATVGNYLFSYLLILFQIGIIIVVVHTLLGLILNVWYPDEIKMLMMASPAATLYAIQKAISVNEGKEEK